MGSQGTECFPCRRDRSWFLPGHPLCWKIVIAAVVGKVDLRHEESSISEARPFLYCLALLIP